MAYLHNSEVNVHGKLRSCNCLIDGRFVLKISDFGLRTLTSPREVVQDQAFYNSLAINYVFLHLNINPNCISELLWIAPELLPMTTIPGTPCSQKGDVYSFAIILEEIVVRGGPYETFREIMEPKGKAFNS